MVPAAGFLDTDSLAEDIEDNPLPELYYGTYADHPRRGNASNVLGVFLGDVSIELFTSRRFFQVTIRQLGVYGAVMIDRIE